MRTLCEILRLKCETKLPHRELRGLRGGADTVSVYVTEGPSGAPRLGRRGAGGSSTRLIPPRLCGSLPSELPLAQKYRSKPECRRSSQAAVSAAVLKSAEPRLLSRAAQCSLATGEHERTKCEWT